MRSLSLSDVGDHTQEDPVLLSVSHSDTNACLAHIDTALRLCLRIVLSLFYPHRLQYDRHWSHSRWIPRCLVSLHWCSVLSLNRHRFASVLKQCHSGLELS